MSAIYGIFGEADLSEVRAMGDRLTHRGRCSGEWSVLSTVHFGQRVRVNQGNAFVPPAYPIVFDGFLDNRHELISILGERGQATDEMTDAWIVFNVYQKFGREGLRQLNGQFTFAIWDTNENKLILARDFWGARPLFYAHIGERYLFASEYKALLAIDEVLARPNLEAIQYVQCTKHPMPGGCYLADVYPVANGTSLTIDSKQLANKRHWNIEIDIAQRPNRAHVEALRTTLLDAMSRQVRPYKTIGISLSGGLDSAALLAAVRHVAPDKTIHTFAAGHGPEDPEIVGASITSRYFGTHHQEIFLDPHDLPTILPPMVWHMEDPLGREENVVHFLIAKEAANHVELLLAGHGSDGLFGGMPRHKVVRAATLLPSAHVPLEEFFAYSQTGTPARTALGRGLIAMYYKGRQVAPPCVLGSKAMPKNPAFPLHVEQPLSEMLRRGVIEDANANSTIERLYAAAGLDFNSPFMDAQVVRCAFQIPDRLKIRGMQQKYILRQACAGLLPKNITNRKKSIVRLKHDHTLSDVLDSLANELLSAPAVASRALFEPSYVEQVQRRPSSGAYSSEQLYRLWSLLLTEMWCRCYLDRRGQFPGHEGAP